MLDLFWIAVAVVIVIDISGVVDSIKSGLKRILTNGKMSDPNYSLKPIDCSFCCLWWSGLVYLLVTHTLSIWMVAYLLGLCVLTPVIKDTIILVRETLLKIIRKCNEEV